MLTRLLDQQPMGASLIEIFPDPLLCKNVLGQGLLLLAEYSLNLWPSSLDDVLFFHRLFLLQYAIRLLDSSPLSKERKVSQCSFKNVQKTAQCKTWPRSTPFPPDRSKTVAYEQGHAPPFQSAATVSHGSGIRRGGAVMNPNCSLFTTSRGVSMQIHPERYAVYFKAKCTRRYVMWAGSHSDKSLDGESLL